MPRLKIAVAATSFILSTLLAAAVVLAASSALALAARRKAIEPRFHLLHLSTSLISWPLIIFDAGDEG